MSGPVLPSLQYGWLETRQLGPRPPRSAALLAMLALLLPVLAYVAVVEDTLTLGPSNLVLLLAGVLGVWWIARAPQGTSRALVRSRPELLLPGLVTIQAQWLIGRLADRLQPLSYGLDISWPGAGVRISAAFVLALIASAIGTAWLVVMARDSWMAGRPGQHLGLREALLRWPRVLAIQVTWYLIVFVAISLAFVTAYLHWTASMVLVVALSVLLNLLAVLSLPVAGFSRRSSWWKSMWLGARLGWLNKQILLAPVIAGLILLGAIVVLPLAGAEYNPAADAPARSTLAAEFQPPVSLITLDGQNYWYAQWVGTFDLDPDPRVALLFQLATIIVQTALVVRWCQAYLLLCIEADRAGKTMRW